MSVKPKKLTPVKRYTFKIDGMDCAEEVAVLKKALAPFVNKEDQLHFDLLNAKLSIDLFDDQVTESRLESRLQHAIKKTGMKAAPWQANQKNEITLTYWQRYARIWLTALSGFCMLIGFLLHGVQHGFVEALVGADQSIATFPVSALLFFVVSILSGGWFIFPRAWLALKRLRADMNLLMTIAVIGAAVIGQWFEAAAVTFLFSIALLLESWSVHRARSAIKTLLDIMPEMAHVKQQDGLTTKDYPLASVAVDEIIIIRPGERVPLDAKVIEGETHINQAPITGESLPVLKKTGDTVYAGTINEEGVLECRVEKTSTDTLFAKIIKQVEEAQASRAKSEQWVERFAHYYTPSMILLSVLIMVIPPLLFGANWLPWIYEGLVILVIACPCALVISTPVSIVAGLSTAASAGILIKGGNYLELPARLAAIAFDKTGTITQGKPIVQKLLAVNGFSEKDVLTLVASLEAQNDHPLARAILQAAKQSQITITPASATKVLKGKGIVGTIDNHTYWVGSHRLLHDKIKNESEINKLHDQILQLEDAGHSLIVIGKDQQLCGLISVADPIRPESRETVDQLSRLNLKTILLTGDNQGTAEAIAQSCHLDTIYAELLPEDKLKKIQAIQEEYGQTAMVGDGINDAPALAAAHLGIAMGVMGTDVAIETADIALMTDNLSKLPWLIKHSQRVLRIIKANITFSLLIKLIFIVLAFAKLATLWMAIAADMGASLIVITNSLRLLR